MAPRPVRAPSRASCCGGDPHGRATHGWADLTEHPHRDAGRTSQPPDALAAVPAAVLPLAYFVDVQVHPDGQRGHRVQGLQRRPGHLGQPVGRPRALRAVLRQPGVLARWSRNTFLLSAYALLASFPIPIILALALNEVRLRFFKRTVQMVTYAPYFISTVVVVSMTILILSPRIGLRATSSASSASADRLPRATPTSSATSTSGATSGRPPATPPSSTWRRSPAIDPSLYEAAKVDGATRLQKIWHVDLPGIMPTAIDRADPRRRQHHGDRVREGVPAAEPAEPLASRRSSRPTSTRSGCSTPNFSLATAVGLFNSVINLVLLVGGQHASSKRVTGSGLW